MADKEQETGNNGDGEPNSLSSHGSENLPPSPGVGGADPAWDHEHRTRSNAKLVERSIREKWPVTDEIRQIATTQMAIAVGRSESERVRVAAARALAQFDRINVQRESNLIAEERSQAVETHQHVHFEALNEGRDIIARVLARVEARRSGGDSAGPGSNGSGDGNGHAGGNGSKPTPPL